MRCLVVALWITVACTAAKEAPVADAPVAVQKAAAAPPTPVAAEKAVATPPTPPAVAPATAPVVAAPPVAPTLATGPERYQLPDEVKCDDMEPGPFCGVYIIDIADRKATTLIRRDGAAWFVRAGASETPTAVEFTTLPRRPDHLKRVDPLFATGSGAFVSVTPSHPILPETFDLPGIRSLYGDFVLLADKLYADALLEEQALVEIDPGARSFRTIEIPGKSLLAVLPGGDNLALYLSGKRRRSVATFDVSTRKLLTEVEIPHELEPVCRRTHHHYGEESAVYVPESGRFYVGFGCYPDA